MLFSFPFSLLKITRLGLDAKEVFAFTAVNGGWWAP